MGGRCLKRHFYFPKHIRLAVTFGEELQPINSLVIMREIR